MLNDGLAKGGPDARKVRGAITYCSKTKQSLKKVIVIARAIFSVYENKMISKKKEGL